MPDRPAVNDRIRQSLIDQVYDVKYSDGNRGVKARLRELIGRKMKVDGIIDFFNI